MYLVTLPPGLENAEALLKRREKAKDRKDKWRSIYRECYRYGMPQRETFDWSEEGQPKETVLFDSTLQECTYTAANTLCALLFPSWMRWAELAFGADIDPKKVGPELQEQLRQATEVFFDYLNHSNFPQVINEMAMDLLAGTGAIDFDEGDDDNPFVFQSVPLAAIELEEGPDGKVETTFMLRETPARNITRTYPGLELFDLPQGIADKVVMKPDEKVAFIQGTVYYPDNGHYYGVVIARDEKVIVWRYDYGTSCPRIVGRATKLSGELYGRGRIMLSLADARTLDKMQEFVLRHAALQVAPPVTAVSDGVLNPYTAVLRPATVLPVASNDQGNPSLRALEIGGNFAITEQIMTDLRARVRRTMLGPEPTEGPVRSATEVNVNDRNRLWAMNGEFGRIQAEVLTKIVARGVYILQKRGKIPKFKINGRQVAVKYTSPFARSQDVEDALAVTNTLGACALIGPEVTALGLKIEDIPGYLAKQYGMPASLVRTEQERDEKIEQAKEMAAQMAPPAEGGPQMAGGIS